MSFPPSTSAAHGRDGLDDPDQRDALTGLPGRFHFEERVAQGLRRATSGATGVVLLDVDRFNHVNDTFGLRAGDDILRTLAARLDAALEPGESLARFGGDEFVVLCEGLAGEPGAIAVAERLMTTVVDPFAVHDRALFLSASVGIAVTSDPAMDAAALMRDANVAKQRAHEDGGRRCQLFDQAMRRRVIERMNLEQDLRRGLDRKELTLFYQPIVSLAERRIVAVEALVRWQHPALGLVPPDAFIPVAEDSGLIFPLGQWVLTEACRQIARWSLLDGIDVPYVTVNLSGRQLANPMLAEQVAEILERTGVPPERLGLELTESVLIGDTASPVASLQRLERLGVRLLLDDFGTGYSSLNHLKLLPIQVLKVDRSFIGGIIEGKEDRHILRAIVELASALGVEVVSEGVETVEQARVVHSLGCRMIQGYLIAAPGEPSGIEALLRTPLDIEAYISATEPEVAPLPVPAEVSRTVDGTVTLGEAATALGVSSSTLRRWADANRIRTLRTVGGHRRFPVAEIRRLNEEATVVSQPVIRTVPLPSEPLEGLGRLLAEQADALIDAATRMLYERQAVGWFGREEGRARVQEWVAAVGTAAGRARYGDATAATLSLLRQSHLAGTAPLERHMLVERFADLTQRALAQREPPHAELVGTRRLFARLRQTLHEAPAGTRSDAR